jgi:Rps23 Pro-64 3,4-dihydroxylase Tpa1-like proline 4-hydroxylase
MNLREFEDNGFIIVDNFLPVDVAKKLKNLFLENKNWELLSQEREKHYSDFLKTELDHFPNTEEVYTAKFWRNEKLENDDNILKVFNKYFLDSLEELNGGKFDELNIRCYYMDSDCHYRTHMDDWIGDIGCMYYFHDQWVWDWGGIVHYGLTDDSDSVVPIFPKFNRAVFSNHKKYKFPHFVSHVTDYAKEKRLSLISFGK